MDKLKWIYDFINKMPLVGKVISVVVITLISVLVVFFSGCASKFHIDHADNMTYEVRIHGR